jgi:hypothetical protein
VAPEDSGTFGFLAALCAGLFAGAAGYLSLVDHWARLQAGSAAALAEFRLRFPRARGIQASLAIAGSLSALIAWLGGAGFVWLLVALLMLGIVVFTLVVIAPVYQALMAASPTAESGEILALLERWGTLHNVRSVLGLLTFLLALAAL